jgi:lysosomal Pro-X carboxypeptidase
VKGSDAPILFYAGNEDEIEIFYKNTGMMTDVWGPQLKALVVFAEHRYYGKSMPFGEDFLTNKESYKYMTVE